MIGVRTFCLAENVLSWPLHGDFGIVGHEELVYFLDTTLTAVSSLFPGAVHTNQIIDQAITEKFLRPVVCCRAACFGSCPLGVPVAKEVAGSKVQKQILDHFV